MTGIGFVRAPEEEYRIGRFTGIKHYTFAPITQEINGCQGIFLSSVDGVSHIAINEKVALCMAAINFASFKPKYASCLEKSVASITRQPMPLEELKDRKSDFAFVSSMP